MKKMFDKKIQDSLKYVIHYNGDCYKLTEKGWIYCKIDDKKLNFTEIYKGLPYEIDANQFAFDNSKQHLNQSQLYELEEIFKKFMPTIQIPEDTYYAIYKEIDEKIKNG